MHDNYNKQSALNAYISVAISNASYMFEDNLKSLSVYVDQIYT